MLGSYDQKLGEFIEGKTFRRLSLPLRNRADAWCDACGSLEPRLLFGLREEATERCFFVGAECLREIGRRGLVRRSFGHESADAAFVQEMARRRLEERGTADTGQPVSRVPQYTTINGGADLVSIQPQVYFFEAAESYIALVQIWHCGKWVWGSAEVPRFDDAWEGQGDGAVVLKQVLRDRSDALAECVRIASEEVLGKLKMEGQAKSGAPSHRDNGHHDWTGFWQAVRELGLEREQLVELIDGLMPRDWLRQHSESALEDLLKLVQQRLEQKLAVSLCQGGGSTEQA
jgi:hypothetical protein